MDEHFYVIAQEPGFGPELMPTWTDHPGKVNPFEDRSAESVTRADIPDVPGAFQLFNVLSDQEAENIIEIAEQLGFHQDSPVSLPHDVRHNENMNWVVSEHIDRVFWERSEHLIQETIGDQIAKGINARFRFYRYYAGDYFKPHSDGAWPGSRVVDGKLVTDAFPGLISQFTYLIFLNDGYEGGRTQFLVSKVDPTKPAKANDDVNVVSIRTPKGGILCFPHGSHPLHCLHAGEAIASGSKYVIRSDILFG